MSMPGVMTITSRDSAGSALNSVKLAGNIPSKMQRLRKLREQLFHADAVILSGILPQLLELLLDRFSPVRKFVTEMIGEIGYKDIEFLPDIAPALLDILKDDTPAVARQAVACGVKLFRYALIKFALQGLCSNEVDESFELWWHWMLKFKETMYSVAFQPGNEGVRLRALKFVESVILLYTPDPDGAPEPPVHMPDGTINEFNISWLRGGHPLLNVRELSAEASKSLGLLLDQLRNAEIKSLSDSTTILLINSLSEIASKRPAFYGRILPVLLGLDPKTSVIKGIRVSATHHALKQAFCTSLKCTHPGAVPWRDRLVCALEEMNAGGLAVEIMHHVCQPNEKIERRGDIAFLEELRSPVKPLQFDEPNFDRKRTVEQHINELIDDSVKRIKVSPHISEPLPDELSGDLVVAEDEFSSHQQAPLDSDGDNGPVQQLVAMFGALVAQGEKAADSLEILISSISSDLLTEVIIANMRHLPSFCPCSEDDDPLKESFHGTDAGVKHLPSFVADILSLPDFFPQIISPSDDRQLFHSSLMTHQRSEKIETLSDNNAHDCMHVRPEDPSVPLSLQASPAPSLPELEGHSVVPSDILDLGGPVGEIPGLGSAVEILDYPEAADMPTFSSCSDVPAPEDGVTMQRGVEGDIILVSSSEKSEECSPKASLTDTSSVVSTAETSFGLSTQVLLPKMSAPLIDLNDVEKDHLQKSAFIRILEAYKQSEAAGGLHIRFGLLASLGIEFPLEFDHWKLLLEHILADYVNNKGHDLTLCILFRLFGESEEERDFFSSTTASSTYEMFLLAVAESLRDSFPSSDKSLARLFGEVPHMPKSLLKLVESLCSPEKSSNDDKGIQPGDRVTQGLSTVWSLILSRPPFRLVCLKIALQSTVHHLEEVRMKAIRLVANKLYALPSVTQQIEDFAKEMLMSVAIDESIMDVEKSVEDGTSLGAINNEVGSQIESHSSSSPQALSFPVSEAQRCMSLYFALCTKKHSLFREIFSIYKKTSMGVKQAVDRQIPMLVRTMGSSPELLEIISDPPIGSESLLFQIVHTLTDGIVPSSAFLSTVRKLYESKLKDAEILIPVLQFLPKEEVLKMFHHIVNLPPERFQAALLRIIQGSHSGAVLTPAEVLIAIHGINPSKDGILLKKITEACNICFEQRQIFTQQVLAQVLNQLVEQIPLPLLFMRTVLQAVGAFPALVEFIMEILSRLVSKQIWKNSKLWVGFLKCAALTKPQSFNVLLQLPPAQLENALARNTALKAPLVAYAGQQNTRTSIPRSLLAVLGLIPDSQPSEPSQTVESQHQPEASTSGKASGIDPTPESSSAT